MELQTVVTTHSPYIVSQSDFEDIKYFHRIERNKIEINNVFIPKKWINLSNTWEYAPTSIIEIFCDNSGMDKYMLVFKEKKMEIGQEALKMHLFLLI